jgi:hypothetical protein
VRREFVVLSDQDQRVWEDIGRSRAEEAEDPARPAPPLRGRAPRDLTDPPALVVAGAWGAILLVLLGALAAGLTVGAVTALGWALWRYWPRLGRTGTTTIRSVLNDVDRGLLAARRPGTQGRPRQQDR